MPRTAFVRLPPELKVRSDVTKHAERTRRAERNGKTRAHVDASSVAAANGLAKILNGSKDPVLVRHVVAAVVQFLS